MNHREHRGHREKEVEPSFSVSSVLSVVHFFCRSQKVALGIIVLLLCGCTSQNPSKAKENALRINIYSEPPTLDPYLAVDITSANLIINLFEGMMRIGPDDLPHPALAERFEVSEDQKTYTFFLRKSLWSNGEPLTAHDFVSGWRKILNPLFPAPFAYKLFLVQNAQQIKLGKLPEEKLGIKALDDYTLTVTLQHPTPYFLELMAFPTFFPLAPDASAFNGPFIIDRWDHDNFVRVKKNPLYWDSSAVHLDKIDFMMIDNNTTECYMFEKGELDWAGSPLSSLPSDILPALHLETRVYTYPARGVLYYSCNTEHFPLNNAKIRKALAYAINRQDLVEHVLQGDQHPALAMVPPLLHWPEHTYFRDGNVQGARKLFAEGLEELGIRPEEFPSLTLSYNSLREHQKVAEAVSETWNRHFGITVHLVSFEWKLFLAKQHKMDFEICRSGWLADFDDPIAFLNRYRQRNDGSGERLNETGWSDPAFTALLNASDYELNLDKRTHLLEEAEKILIDQMPVMPLYFLTFNYLKKPYVHDVYLSPLGIIDFKYASVDH